MTSAAQFGCRRRARRCPLIEISYEDDNIRLFRITRYK